MANIILLDENFSDYKLVDTYSSLIWTTRFKEAGDFELQLPATEDNIKDFIPDRYLFNSDFYTKSDTEEYAHLMVIETAELSDGILKISGRSLKSILDRRIVWGTKTVKAYTKFEGTSFLPNVEYYEEFGDSYRKTEDTTPDPNKRYFTKTRVEEAIAEVINFNIIVPLGMEYPDNYPGNYRRIPNFVLGDFTGYDWGIIEEEIQYDGTSIMEVVNDLCTKSSLTDSVGYTVIYNFKTKCIEFRLYKPKNRTLDQYINVPITFSEKFSELKSSKYLESTAAYKNVAYVSGEKYSDDEIDRFHQVAVVGTQDASALTRRELFVDATSMQHELSDGTIYSTATYQDMLVQKGNTELKKKENRYSKVFEGEVDFERVDYIFGKDYDIGDIVEITNQYGVNKKVRVVEMVASVSTSGITLVPGFEDVDTEEDSSLEYGAVEGGTEHIAYLTEEMLGTIIGDSTSEANQEINNIIDLKDFAYASDLSRTERALTSEIDARSNGDLALQSLISQTAHTIALSVTQPQANSTASIVISLLDENGDLLNNATGTITMTGLVTFTALANELDDYVSDSEMSSTLNDYATKSSLSAGTTTINGGCITTGNIYVYNSSTGYWTKIETANGNLSWNMAGSEMTTEGVLTLHGLETPNTSGGITYRAGLVIDDANGSGIYSMFSHRSVFIVDPNESYGFYLNKDSLIFSYNGNNLQTTLDLNGLYTYDGSYHYSAYYHNDEMRLNKYNSSNTSITSYISITSSTIKYYNGSTTTNFATQTWVQNQGYLTSHQSLSGYATQTWVQNQGYLTSHQSLSSYLTKTTAASTYVAKSGDTMTGDLTISRSSNTAQISCTNSYGTIRMTMGTGTYPIIGIYDTKNSSWIIKHDRGTLGGSTQYNVYLPRAGAVTTSSGSANAVLGSTGGLCRYASSSKRYKNHITYIDDDELLYSETIKAARDFKTVIYKYNDGYVSEVEAAYYNFGFIAEDLEESIGNYVVCYDEESDDPNAPERWDVYPLVSIITTLAQDNANRLDEKDKEIAELKDRVSKLENLVEKLLAQDLQAL